MRKKSTLGICWAKVPFIDNRSKSKIRPVVILGHSNHHQTQVLPITSKYDAKSIRIKFSEYPIKNWRKIPYLRKPSYVKVNDVLNLPNRYVNQRLRIGHLNTSECISMFKYGMRFHKLSYEEFKTGKREFTLHNYRKYITKPHYRRLKKRKNHFEPKVRIRFPKFSKFNQWGGQIKPKRKVTSTPHHHLSYTERSYFKQNKKIERKKMLAAYRHIDPSLK